MHGPDGNNYPNEAEFAEIVPNEKVVIRHQCQPFFTLTISLKASANGTLVHWNQAFDDDEIAEKVAHIVVPSNEQNLDRLMEEVYDPIQEGIISGIDYDFDPEKHLAKLKSQHNIK